MSNPTQSMVQTFRQHADSRVITKVPVLENRATPPGAVADAHEPVVAGRCRLLDGVGTEIDSLAVLQVVHTYSTGFRSCPWSTSCSAMSQWRWSPGRLRRRGTLTTPPETPAIEEPFPSLGSVNNAFGSACAEVVMRLSTRTKPSPRAHGRPISGDRRTPTLGR